MPDKELSRFFRRGKALAAVRDILSGANEIRIATAFFELSGYKLLADILSKKTWKLLIGTEEGSPEKVQSFLTGFVGSVEKMENISERIEALQMLRKMLLEGKVKLGLTREQQSPSVSPAFLAHHAKLYMADASRCLVTSANFTATGLVRSLEAGIVVTAQEDVAYFVQRFDEVFALAEPITENLIELIEEMLSLRSPWEVYMRSLLEIYGIAENNAPGPLPPLSDYQKPVVASSLQSLREHRGSFLIASTGLGKTIMASHIARILRNENSIERALIICPAGLKDMWARSMRQASVSSREFTFQILSLNDWIKYRNVQYLEEELKSLNSQTLLIIDESHHLRNEKGISSKIKLRNGRLKKAAESGARVLLMTATPYSRTIEDINNQLKLLPRTTRKALIDTLDVPWNIYSPQELSTLEIASVLTAPTVVSYFSQTDETGNRFILFNKNEKRYFPSKIELRSVKFQNAANPVLEELLKSQLLRIDDKNANENLFSGAPAGKKSGLFEARLVHQFCSSLHLASHALRKIGNTGALELEEEEEGYSKIRFKYPAELQALAKSLHEKLSRMKNQGDDNKFTELLNIIRNNPSEKIVVFVIYRETAKNLSERLKQDLPDRSVERTSDVDPEKLDYILKRFAPVASGVISPGQDDEFSRNILSEKIDILIATEAVSEGYNLQDASILVNYDLPWTVLHLAQRMGRILRPWHNPRKIQIWNFMPDTMDAKVFPIAQNWQRRLEQRSGEHASIGNLPVLAFSEKEEVSLYSYSEDLSEIFNSDIGIDETLSFIESTEKIRTTTVFDDLAQLTKDDAIRIKKIRNPFRAVKQTNLKESQMFSLFQKGNRLYTYLFDAGGKKISGPDEQQKNLVTIRSSRTEDQHASISLTEYDEWLQRGRDSFCREMGFSVEELSVICSVALLKQNP